LLELVRRRLQLQQLFPLELAAYAKRAAYCALLQDQRSARSRRRREQEWSDAWVRTVKYEEVVEDALARGETLQECLELWGHLPTELRAVVGCFASGYTASQTARELDIPLGTAKSRLRKARAILGRSK
jgi:DNA-directed RNA polymerase specialized sigma24 family protein